MVLRAAKLILLAVTCGVALAGVIVPGCAFPDYDFPGRALDGGSLHDADAERDAAVADADDADASVDSLDGATDTTLPGPEPTRCPVLAAALACGIIPDMPAPDVEVLDGKGEEFCTIAPRGFAVVKGAHVKPPDSGATQQATIRIAVSARGVHLHVQVLDDPWIAVQDDLVQGDAVELFVRGVHDPITGKLGSDGGRHLVFVPPSPGKSADGREVRSDGTYGALSAAFFGVRAVSGGYEVEVRLPWTELGGQPAPGDQIGFDVGIDVSDDETLPRRVQSFLYYQAPAGGTTCGGSAEPSCDDRTWCAAYAYSAP